MPPAKPRRSRVSPGSPRKSQSQATVSKSAAGRVEVLGEKQLNAHESIGANESVDGEKEAALASALKDAHTVAQLLDAARGAQAGIPPLTLTLLADALHKRLLQGEEASSVPSDGQAAAVRIDWTRYARWPQGLLQEELALNDYLKRLKFIHLEVETKRLFLAQTMPGFAASEEQAEEEEEVIYSAADVAALEQTAAELKEQMRGAKAQIKSLRSAIDACADSLLPVNAVPLTPSKRSRRAAAALDASGGSTGAVSALSAHSQEASALIEDIADLELRIARTKAAGGGSRPNFEDRKELERIPKLQTLTSEEAAEWCDRQIDEMQYLAGASTSLQRSIDARKAELVAAHRSLDRLNVERGVAEQYAEEADRAGVVQDAAGGRAEGKGRDLEVERICLEHADTLEILRTILGVQAISAPDNKTLRIVYSVAAREDGSATLLLHFDKPGGKLLRFIVRSEDGEDLLQGMAPPHSHARAALDAACASNDAPLLVQELIMALDAA